MVPCASGRNLGGCVWLCAGNMKNSAIFLLHTDTSQYSPSSPHPQSPPEPVKKKRHIPTMLPPRAPTAITALRHLQHTTARLTSRSTPISPCASLYTTRDFSTFLRGISTRTTPTRSLHGTSTSTSAAGLLSGKSDKRPAPEVLGLGRDVSEQAVRGMKVRSSVKKVMCILFVRRIRSISRGRGRGRGGVLDV
ncbi:hypothetical protein BDR22DRAFT_319731 [Usnea florida]